MHQLSPTPDAREQQVLQQLAALPALSIEELARRWTALTGHPAPRQNKRALVKRLAYALQEAAWGGLSPDTVARLEAIAQRQADTSTAQPPMTGSAYVRTWHGTTYRVNVLRQGFEYGGRYYTSLSAIARAITGTRISGPAFFRGTGGAA
ncbi:MAG TPA: DUF2924 domain-containing protein [Armatimonadota bacterium]|jgi:hypothetical protein